MPYNLPGDELDQGLKIKQANMFQIIDEPNNQILYAMYPNGIKNDLKFLDSDI